MVLLAAGGEPSAGSQARQADVPPNISKLAATSGCRIANDRLPAGTAAWASDAHGSAHAAWCVRQRRGEAVYDLLVDADSQHPWASCPPHVRMGLDETYPQLRIVMLPKDLPYSIALNRFIYLTENYWLMEPTRVESDGVPKGPAIDFGFGDAGQIVMCHQGKWILAGYH